METLTNRFTIVDEKGREYEVLEYTKMNSIPAAFGETVSKSVPGTSRLVTSEDYPVNPLSDDEFEIQSPENFLNNNAIRAKRKS